ncbi:MAG TPA: flavodoxin domain-containing protein [Clostridia bacterium]|nr:flavodoxin domain-containing protein [Clostridia bacterium]
MADSVLIVYATRYGSTKEAAEAIAAALKENGLVVDIKPAREAGTVTGYDAIVLGAPLFMFHWHKDALRFLSKHSKALAERHVAVFALGPTHDPYDREEWQASRSQLDKELMKFPWLKPVAIEIFGGKYDPAKLSFPLNLFAGEVPASDIRHLTAVRTWAGSLAGKL